MWVLRAALAIGLAASCLASARAQSINPGVIQNDVDRQRRQLEQQSAPPKLTGPAVIGGEREKSQLLKPGGPKFRLRKVTFDESKFITPAELDEIAKKYVGKDVDIAALLQLVADINAVYAARGIVTGIATLPEQDAKGGVVRIKLTEGRLQKTTVEGNKQTRADYILQRVKEPEGEVLDVPKLNRDVIWFNRTNDVQIKALLQPGTSFGLTDLQFAVIEPPTDTLQLFVDNQGPENTGRWEGGGFYKRHGLFGVDDRLTFYGVRSDGNLNGNVAYSIPVNPWGGRAGVSYTEGKIKIIQGPFVALDVTGRSSQAAVNFSQPVWVTQDWLVLVNAALTEGKTVSRFGTVAVTDNHYDKTTAGISVTRSGNTYSITVSPAVNYIAWHDYVLGNNRAFNTYTGSLIATSAAGPANFSANVLASWQYTPETLLPGDQIFSIGGPTTVRGYPSNAASGDSGYYFNAELHYNWSQWLRGFDTYIFTDWGAVYSTFPGVTEMSSVGVGFSWTYAPFMTFEANYATPLKVSVSTQNRYEAYGRVIFRPLLMFQKQESAAPVAASGSKS
ncbi:ShlB/FhaC/HecB family hemolysin secretion/activation protein [Bradyrhizobium sp. WBOS7]|uniref:ShlB/FhaC/HecB family hemolysin secretion/activation protein n=1 Tax=Bradyrhizobium betae TaxID=244734 RepID=A0AAE9ST63_9BRAD|nr:MULTISPECIES: ShlB/FhaC/HecB family hemolysin secretion/activation protein [Bradyrhizobium]MDD1571834.1 ShlB/FhaC/HecB family hemolysin secretion/activation protein [Bradyrhizobium sp. WBOS1]UUO36231.1 ShlB/FhaC/HecB family hemolysin secretion/activation protein [Bradyrhizobium sp. WBOS01]MDD1526698.1 ShlB/FhaC/HecB family hemolysin secretion/activation protein [Bradyrhizobium sp. WBOS2]MDD1575338.1 ShlB/FhaC/HecB family hemolysin secretion/activation protein [Bradyrhizobium sp. WBOS7]MDD16